MKLTMNRTTLTVIGFLIIGGYFLWTEHSAHLALALPYLPWLLLLACPLLHLFMHGGHGHGEHKKPPADDQMPAPPQPVQDTTRVPQTGGRHE